MTSFLTSVSANYQPSNCTHFVSDFFQNLNAAEIDYSVLRGYETLPSTVINDIDLYLKRSQWGTVDIIIAGLCLRHSGKKIVTINRFDFKRIILFIDGGYLQLDISFSVNWKSFFYCAEDQVKDNTKLHNNIRVSREGVEAAIVLLKELLYNGRVKTRRQGKERLLFCVQKDTVSFRGTLSAFLPRSIVDTLTDEILKEQWAKVESKAGSIRRSIIVSNIKKYGLRTIRSLCKWCYLASKDLIEVRRGCFAAIIGPDGSGKTTLVNEVNQELNKTLFTRTNHYASNFEILPLLSNIICFIKGKKVASNNRGTDLYQGYHSGMKQKPNSALRSCIYIVWYGLDLVLGRWIIFRKKARGELLFFARYFYDYYYQRANRNAPRWLLNSIHWFIPRPDVVFYIDRQAKDIFEMKPELAMEEIEHQQQLIQKLAQADSRFVKIDGNQGINESKKQIVDSINNLLASRA